MDDENDSEDFLEKNRRGLKELEQSGITAHDFAARNVCAFNVEFLSRCDGGIQMEVSSSSSSPPRPSSP